MPLGIRNKTYFTILVAFLICSVAFALTAGKYHISMETCWRLIQYQFKNAELNGDLETAATVLWSVRLPRIFMAVIVGSALAVAGVVFQGLMRNPLVAPSILGISQGAMFGAALGIVAIGKTAIAVEVSAFIGAIIAITIVYLIGSRGNNFITTLVLAGVIVSGLFNAGLSFLKYQADPYEELPAIVFWMMGGFNNILWPNVIRAGIISAIAITIILLLRWRLNLFALGEEEASAMGVNVKGERKIYILFATLLVASSSSSCGVIIWADLVVAHMARLIIGPDHNILIPFAAVLGAVFILVVDTVIRCLPSGEMPISIFTSFVGAPAFVYLLIKQNRYWT